MNPASEPAEGGSSALTPDEQAILSFERKWWKYAGSKEQAVRAAFGLSATQYYQVVNALIDRPEALAFDPMVVQRLRRLRQLRRRSSARAPDPTGL